MQAQTPSRVDRGPTTELPAELDTAGAKLVYLALSTAGPATADDLRSRLDLGKLTLFPILGTLEDRDLVDRDGERYVAC